MYIFMYNNLQKLTSQYSDLFFDADPDTTVSV